MVYIYIYVIYICVIYMYIIYMQIYYCYLLPSNQQLNVKATIPAAVVGQECLSMDNVATPWVLCLR